MIRRLLTVLLALCLAAPALAAPPHCAQPGSSAVAASMQHHRKHHEQPAQARQGHDCIGCAMPAGIVAPFAMAPFYPAETQRWINAAAPPATAVQPDTPPPRT